MSDFSFDDAALFDSGGGGGGDLGFNNGADLINPDGSTVLPPTPPAGGAPSQGFDYQKLAQGLKAVSDATAQGPQKPAVSNLSPGAQAAAGQAASGAYNGNPAAMNALVQMLMQRVQELRAASNPANARPVNLGGGSRPGLLGL
jgi:hypothetical protein